MTTAPYIVATHEVPTIVCPDWCTVPVAEHIDDLPNWEGGVVHRSADRELCPGFTAGIASAATPAGVVTEPADVHLYIAPDELPPADALAAGRALVALAKEALHHP